jgi:hypothetical protein
MSQVESNTARQIRTEHVAPIEALHRHRLTSSVIARRLVLPLSTIGCVLHCLGFYRLNSFDPPAWVVRSQRQPCRDQGAVTARVAGVAPAAQRPARPQAADPELLPRCPARGAAAAADIAVPTRRRSDRVLLRWFLRPRRRSQLRGEDGAVDAQHGIAALRVRDRPRREGRSRLRGRLGSRVSRRLGGAGDPDFPQHRQRLRARASLGCSTGCWRRWWT